MKALKLFLYLQISSFVCQRAFSSLHVPDAQLQQALDLYRTSIHQK